MFKKKPYNIKWAKENPEKVRAYQKKAQEKFRKIHPERQRIYKKKYCLTHSNQLKVASKKYYESHKEQRKVSDSIYYQSHKEQINKRSRKWAESNLEKARKAIKKFCSTYPERNRASCLRWRLKHPNYSKKWRQTLEGKNSIRRMDARRRNFGFIPLNDSFPGAEGHHINLNYVIYIPKKLHRSVWHSITSGQGMKEINKKAFEFLRDLSQFLGQGVLRIG